MGLTYWTVPGFQVARIDEFGRRIILPVQTINVKYWDGGSWKDADPATIVTDDDGLIPDSYVGGYADGWFRFDHSSYPLTLRRNGYATIDEARLDVQNAECSYIVEDLYEETAPIERVEIYRSNLSTPDAQDEFFAHAPTVGGDNVVPFESVTGGSYRYFAQPVGSEDRRAFTRYADAPSSDFSPASSVPELFDTQPANTFYAGPTSGPDAEPTFRTMVTADIPNNAVTLAKLATMATTSLLGRKTAGTGNVEVLTASDGRTVLGLGTAAILDTDPFHAIFDDGGLELHDNTGSGGINYLIVRVGETLSSTRTLNIVTGNATRTLTFAGNATISGTNSGDQTITLTGDVTGSGTGSFAATIANSAVTLAKMANMTTASLIYRKTAGTGAPEVNTLATLKTDLGLTGTNSGDQTITLTGDVTGSGTGSFAATIANNAVTLAKMATMATASILGRNTAGTGNVEVLSASTVKSILSLNNVENTALSTWAGTSNITTLGTITTGTWHGTAISLTYIDTDNFSAIFADLGLSIYPSGGSPNTLKIRANETLTGNKTLNLVTGNSNRTLTFTADATIGGTHSGTSSGTNTGDQTITLTGDVTGSGTGSFAATIANNAVTLAKMATMATSSILGRKTASTGNVEVLSASDAKNILSLGNVENTALSTWAGSSNITTLGTIAGLLTVNNNIYLSPSGTTPRIISWGGSYGSAAQWFYDGGATQRIGLGIGSSELQFFVIDGSHFSFSGGGDFNATPLANEWMRIVPSGIKFGGTAQRSTTEGTNKIALFNGTAPVGTLSNGADFYCTSGEMRVMDSAGNSTLLSPHDKANKWIYYSKHTPSGRVLRMEMEDMLFALDALLQEHGHKSFIKEYFERPGTPHLPRDKRRNI